MAKVKALKSFEFDGEIKNPWGSEEFEIPDNRVKQFVGLGLVVLADAAKAPIGFSDEQAQSASDDAAEVEAPRRSRRTAQK